MKKKIGTLIFSMMLSLSMAMTAHATEADGGGDSGSTAAGPFQVTFTGDQKLVSNFGASDVDNGISGMMPGDTASFSVTLDNGDSGEAQWYMKNTIIKSMEEMGGGGASGASGGAYSYRLTYIPPEGEPTVLFDSAALGGDNGLGLHEADEALEDHLYLGNLMAGEKGTVTLEVGLDGETQDNSYMIQSANLSMNFAVIPELRGGPGGNTHRTVRREVVNDKVVYLDEDGDLIPLEDLAARLKGAGVVKTGDGTALSALTLAACVSGTLLMAYGFFAVGRRKKGAEGGGGR